MNDYKYVKSSRDKRKEQIVEVMGGKCQLCGYDKCLAALELHHINPEEKDFSFNKASNDSWERLIPEMKKCILLCANCHREVHYQKSVELKSSFMEEIAVKITKEIEEKKNRQVFKCQYCGQEVSHGRDCCVNCRTILKRKVERPTREELKKLIRELPFTKIGQQYGVSDNAVRKWCISENLPSHKNEIKKISDENWEQL